MAIALLAKLRSLHTAAIQYPYIVITLPRIIAISSHTYVSRTIRLEPALTYLSHWYAFARLRYFLSKSLRISTSGKFLVCFDLKYLPMEEFLGCKFLVCFDLKYLPMEEFLGCKFFVCFDLKYLPMKEFLGCMVVVQIPEM